jgi:hypothetical protein
MIEGSANALREREHGADSMHVRSKSMKQRHRSPPKKLGRSRYRGLQTGGLTRDSMGLSRQRSSRKLRRCEGAAARIDADFGHQEVVA